VPLTTNSLLDELLAHGHRFSFPQVMRLARRHLDPNGEHGLPGVPWQDRVQVRPELSLAFPAADVARVEQEGGVLRVTATFLELYGPASPLPTFFTEDLMDEAANDETVVRDFIDLIQQRLYQLYFHCWSKYRLIVRVVEDNNPIDRERLLCLIGLGEPHLAASVADATALLRYTGILSQYPRSASGLATILRDLLALQRIGIVQNRVRLVAIPADQRLRLGMAGCRLGMDSILGSEIADRMGAFRIRIGPVSWQDYNDLLPGTPRHDTLADVTGFYLTDPLDVILELILAAGEAKPMRLGDGATRLGLNSWCFAGDDIGQVGCTFPLTPPVRRPAVPNGPSARPGSSFVDQYRQERFILDDLAHRFTKTHPNLAPLMGGPLADPGIERLLEGTAFLNALLQKKLDDDFPEFIHEVIQNIQPGHLRPVPATTIVAFMPKPNCTGTQIIAKGTELDSIPLDGTVCRFRTSSDVTVHPLILLAASYLQPSGKQPRITLHFELNGLGLSAWRPESLRFFLADDYPDACDLLLLLLRYLERITVTSGTGESIDIPNICLRPVGFAEDETMLGGDKSLTPGHQLLQEFLLFRDKFMFLDLTGLERCSVLGDNTRFAIDFELSACLPVVPKITENSFVLAATPAVNLFKHTAKPILFESGLARHPVHPFGKPSAHFAIYSVDRVTGLDKGASSKIVYDIHGPLPHRSSDGRSCHITHCASLVDDALDTFISINCHEDENRTARIKLEIDLTCTNGNLPERLVVGDIRNRTSSIPESVEPRNITNVTAALVPDSQRNRHWRLFSGFSLNSISLGTTENFRAMLRLFIHSKSGNRVAAKEAVRQIDSIMSVEAVPTNRLIGRAMYRGYDILLKLGVDGFAGLGDLFLFGAVMERFLGGYVTQNCFMRLVVEEIDEGCRFEWPARMGDRWLA
jgi:type VI secretion system protein ImpG